MNKYWYRRCYWYAEDKDMSATIPYCRYSKDTLYSCPCLESNDDCEHYIDSKDVDEYVRSTT